MYLLEYLHQVLRVRPADPAAAPDARRQASASAGGLLLGMGGQSADELPALPTPAQLAHATSDVAIQAYAAWSARNRSIVADVFASFLKRTVTCGSCGKTSSAFGPALTLPLSVMSPQAGARPRWKSEAKTSDLQDIGAVAVDECLLEFARESVVSAKAVPGFSCAHCRSKRASRAVTKVTRLPKVLILQAARFGTHNRVMQPLVYESTLDAAPLLDPFAGGPPQSTSYRYENADFLNFSLYRACWVLGFHFSSRGPPPRPCPSRPSPLQTDRGCGPPGHAQARLSRRSDVQRVGLGLGFGLGLGPQRKHGPRPTRQQRRRRRRIAGPRG